MKAPIIAISVIATMVSLVFFALHSCTKFETPEYEFATWEFAVASGQTGEGKWIPSNLAVGATDIKATYAIDSTYTQVAFRLPQSKDRTVPTDCASIAGKEVPLSSRYARWWPSYLRASTPPLDGVHYYKCSDDAYLAYFEGQGFFWRL